MHLSYKHTLFSLVHIFFLCLILTGKHMHSYYIRTTFMLLVLHAAQVLAHYLMINQLSATADSCEQTALEGSQPGFISGGGKGVLSPTLGIDLPPPLAIGFPYI